MVIYVVGDDLHVSKDKDAKPELDLSVAADQVITEETTVGELLALGEPHAKAIVQAWFMAQAKSRTRTLH